MSTALEPSPADDPAADQVTSPATVPLADRVRRVFIVLSARSLGYASSCISTLFDHALETVDLTLITDDADDKAVLDGFLGGLDAGRHSWQVVTRADCDDLAADRFAGLEGLRRFRAGHPCWLKITDPLLLSAPEDEVIVLDPDLYFPNAFTFEPTPRTGVVVMRQGPNCLFPPAAVWKTFDLGVRLANHVDIGVAQTRADAIDLDWFDWLAREIGTREFAGFMHIEAIVWSAMAMRFGGAHLNPERWRCWERGYVKRLLVAAGVDGRAMLKLEPLARLKCIHVSGPSKWWVAKAIEVGTLRPTGNVYDQPSDPVPYRELTRARYGREQRLKRLFRRPGSGS